MSRNSRLLLPKAFHIQYDSIDQEHEHLIAIANDCLSRAVDGKLLAFEPYFENFSRCMAMHFENEERLMDAARYPEQEQHKKHHRQCLAKIQAICEDCRRKGYASRDAVIDCFDQIIRDAGKADLLFAEFLEGRGTGPSAAALS